MKKTEVQKKIKKILLIFFKKKNTFYSMENVDDWDSLNHLKLMSRLQKEFKISLSPRDISNSTDENKIITLILLKKKIKI